MNLYLLLQRTNTGYATYDRCLVLAKTEGEARLIRPDFDEWGNEPHSWVEAPEQVQVIYLGAADQSLGLKTRLLMSSFQEAGFNPEETEKEMPSYC